MWEWLKQADNLKAIGTIGSAVANGYSGYKQSQAANDILDIQKKAYNRGIAREDKSDNSFDEAINTTFASNKKKKKEISMDLGV